VFVRVKEIEVCIHDFRYRVDGIAARRTEEELDAKRAEVMFWASPPRAVFSRTDDIIIT
jgi:hypothetical protein